MATQLNFQSLGVGAFGLRALPKVRPIRSCPGYLAGDDGSIWSTRRGTLHKLKVRKDKDGYLRLNLRIHGKHTTRHVHTLVAEAFISEPLKGMEVNHVNAVKPDNKITNLEVTDRQGNAQHAYRLGLLFPIGGWNRLKAELKRRLLISSGQGKQISLYEVMSLYKLRMRRARQVWNTVPPPGW